MPKNQEAIIYLAKRVWKHSENKGKVITYLILFSLSNLVLLMYPLLIAKIVNTIQLEGVTQGNLVGILLWITAYLFLDIIFGELMDLQELLKLSMRLELKLITNYIF